MVFRKICGPLLIVWSICFARSSALAQEWEVIDLGPERLPSTINNPGLVGAGPYLYTPGFGVELTLDPGFGTRSKDYYTHITDTGDYVGTYSVITGVGGCHTLSYPVNSDPQEFSVPLRIGESGLHVGSCQSGCATYWRVTHSCLRNLDGSISLIDFGEADFPAYDAAYAINASDVVVGGASRGSGIGQLRAFTYVNSLLTDLGTFGGDTSEARDISDSGIVVGWADNNTAQRRAFRYDVNAQSPSLEELPGFDGEATEAYAINESGTIVGIRRASNQGTTAAVLWRSDQTAIDLNSVAPAGSGWSFVSADGINEEGEIIGTGYLGDEVSTYRGFVLRPRPATGSRLNNDYSGDAIGDSAVWRPGSGYWYVRNSDSPHTPAVYQWGLPGDIPVRADFDGDGRLDLIVWRPSLGTWYRCYSGNNYACGAGDPLQFGLPVDYPLAGDFDGDGRDDVVVWRPLLQLPGLTIEGQWYFQYSATSEQSTEQWGLREDLPVPDDYDGDGRTDIAVWRPSTGVWYILKSSENYNKQAAMVTQWGLPGDHPMPMDLDGDGRAEFVVWRPESGNWYVCRSRTRFDCSQGVVHQWGLPGDIPVRGTFDGSISANLTVWRPLEGNWYTRSLNRDSLVVIQWGLPGDKPLGLGIKDSLS